MQKSNRISTKPFFLISGFYSFYTDDSKALNTYKRRSNKLIKLLLIVSVLYFYMVFAKFPDLLLKLNLNALLDLIIFNVTPFGFHLWFTLALIFCYLLYYTLIKLQIKPNTLYNYIPILILFSLVLGEFFMLIFVEVYAKEIFQNL